MNNPIFLLIFYAVILGGFWFLLMRPQKKEQNARFLPFAADAGGRLFC